jgi:hypothetical protein
MRFAFAKARPGPIVAVLLVLAAGIAIGGASAASASTISVGPGRMGGRLTASVGDWISVGYHFRYEGRHSAATMEFADSTFTSSSAKCVGTETPVTLLLTAPTQRYQLAESDKDFVPAKDQADPSTFQGAARYGVDTPDLCEGGQIDISGGFTYSADVRSTQAYDQLINVQFHYRVPAAKHKENVDCSSAVAGPAVCGAGWSASAKILPDLLAFAPRISTIPTAPAGLGQLMGDSATITEAAPWAEGSVTFRAFGPNDQDCAGFAAFQSTVFVSADQSGTATVSSGTFVLTQFGEYHWTAAYSGDPGTATQPAASDCADEVVNISA